MKALAMLFVLCASVVFGGVQMHEGKVTADFYSEPLQQVIQELQQTGIHFSIEEGVENQTVSASFQDLPVGMAIKKMLEGTGINYAVISNGNGEPQAVFMGSSERPGAASRRLDTRGPGSSYGVVTPVAPLLPPTTRVPEDKQRPARRPVNPTVNVPTGGGFVPDNTQQPPKTEEQENPPPEDEDTEQ